MYVIRAFNKHFVIDTIKVLIKAMMKAKEELEMNIL